MRGHQRAVLERLKKEERARGEAIKRMVLVWHRRAGKDLFALNYIVKQAKQKKGLYWHVYPTYAQGRKALWDAMDKTGTRFLDALSEARNDVTMRCTFGNGSVYQVIGSSVKKEDLRGANPIGVVFSEYSYMKPSFWESIVRPILKENGGWALFLYTPNGQNHGYDLFEHAKADNAWYAERRTIEETFEVDGVTPVISLESIEQDRREGMDEDLIQQEYFCEFLGYLHGSYFSKVIQERRQAGAIKPLTVDSGLPVTTYWDIGMNTAIWFLQVRGEELAVVDYLEGSDQGLSEYFCRLQEKARKEGYRYAAHVFPHDLRHFEWGSGFTRLETAKQLSEELKLGPVETLERYGGEKYSVPEGIHLARRLLERCVMDGVKCELGLKALMEYKQAYDQKRERYLDYPERNQWSSHAADAFRYMAIDVQERRRDSRRDEIERLRDEAKCDYNYLTF